MPTASREPDAIRAYATLARGWAGLESEIAARLKEHHIREDPTEIIILHGLSHSPSGRMTISDLCHLTGLPRSTVNTTLKRMYETGVVARATKGRSTLVVLTANGDDRIASIVPRFTKIYERAIIDRPEEADEEALDDFLLLLRKWHTQEIPDEHSSHHYFHPERD